MTTQQETDELMRAMAVGLDEVLNNGSVPKVNGFVLLTFPFSGVEGARTNYISNANRGDVIAAMKEVIARFEGQPRVQGNA